MRTSQNIASLAAALCKAQAQVKDAVKRSNNPYFKSKYAPIEEVIAACKEALNSNGISFVQGAEPTDGDIVQMSTMLLHTSGEWIESTLTMRPVKNDPQGIGSCITYARRYSLAAICGVASEEDDDGNAASHEPTPKQEPAQKQAAPKHWSQQPSGEQTLESVRVWLGTTDYDRDTKNGIYSEIKAVPVLQAALDKFESEKKKYEEAK